MSERNRTVLRRVGAGGLRGRCCRGLRDRCLLLWLGLGLRLALRGCVRRMALLELEAVVASVLVAPMILGGLSVW